MYQLTHVKGGKRGGEVGGVLKDWQEMLKATDKGSDVQTNQHTIKGPLLALHEIQKFHNHLD
jgi:hypothetical protein